MSGSAQTTPIEMPQLGSGGEESSAGAALASWLVAVGDRVEAGDVIAELETDKATVELESPASGRIAALRVEAGTEGLQPGTVLGEIAVEGEEAAAVEGAMPSAESEPAPRAAADEGVRGDPATAGSGAAAEVGREEESTPRRRPTPLARRAAAAQAIDLSAVEGSGPGGRVLEADVLRAALDPTSPEGAGTRIAGAVRGDGAGAEAASEGGAASGPSSGPPPEPAARFRVERLSSMRRTIARRLSESKQSVPHFYLRARVALDEVIAVRGELNEALSDEGRTLRLSLNDFVVRATALALRDVPAANVQFGEDGMRFYERADVSVAVATDGGLVTPVVLGADRKGLVALSEEIRGLAEQARSGRLRPEQYQGGTITVSNLGMYGIETVYPILNPPQACIVGVGAAEAQPVVRDGEIAVAQMTAITLAADHRAVDGAVGAQLLAALRGHLEDPLGMIL